MSETSPKAKTSESRAQPRNIVLALVIIVAIVGATWWMGERNGWSDIGTGGENLQLLPKPGQEAPEFFTLATDDGKEYVPIQLSQFKGQPVWLNFWGSWCQPCRAEMPDFIKAYDALNQQGIVILAVSVGENPEQAIEYRDTVGGKFPVLIDPSFIDSSIQSVDDPDLAARYQSMRNDWQIKNYPTHVFIDADGIVRKVVISQMSEAQMLETATNLINGSMSIMPPAILITRFD